MNHRMSSKDFIVVYVFILFMVVATGAFFFGLNVGQKQTTAKYEAAEQEKALKQNSPETYTEQELASFYHTVYQPYDYFWGTYWSKADRSNESLPFKEWKQQANDALKQISALPVSENSALLVDAQLAYIKSLKQFIEALDGKPDTYQKLYATDAYKNSLEQGLKAQQLFYQ